MTYLLNTDIEFSSFVVLHKEAFFRSLSDYKANKAIDKFQSIDPFGEIVAVFSNSVVDLNFLNIGKFTIFSEKLYGLVSPHIETMYQKFKLSAYSTRGKLIRKDLYLVLFEDKSDALDLEEIGFDGGYKTIFSAPNEINGGKIIRSDNLAFKMRKPSVFLCDRLPDILFPLFISQEVLDLILMKKVENIEIIPSDDLFVIDLNYTHHFGYYLGPPKTQRLSVWKKRPPVPDRNELWDPFEFDPERIKFD